MIADRSEFVPFLVAALVERLGRDAIADHDADLFELGLDSIDAVEVTGEIEGRFGVEIDPGLLFECRTVNGLADALSSDLVARRA